MDEVFIFTSNCNIEFPIYRHTRSSLDNIKRVGLGIFADFTQTQSYLTFLMRLKWFCASS